MRRNLLWIEILLLLLTGLLAYASSQIDNTLLVSGAILCFSLFLFVVGGDALVNRKMGFFPKNPNFGPTETYQGLTAQLWGIIFIFFGVCALVLAILSLTLKGGMVEFWSTLFSTNWGWGIVLVIIGLVVLMMGIIRMIAGSGGYYKGWQDKVQRITGIIPTLFGLALLVLGVILILFPGLLKSLFDQVINLLRRSI